MRKVESFDLYEASLMPDGSFELGYTNIKYTEMEKTQEQKAQSLIEAGIELMYDRVLVVPSDPELKSRGGIIIPDTAKEIPRKGIVVDLGPDCHGTNDPEKCPRAAKVRKGCKVVYGKYAGSEIKINDVDAVLLREHDILFIYPESTEIHLTM